MTQALLQAMISLALPIPDEAGHSALSWAELISLFSHKNPVQTPVYLENLTFIGPRTLC